MKPLPHQIAAMHAGRDRFLNSKFQGAGPLSPDQEQVIIGSLFGDGCLFVPKLGVRPIFAEAHSEAQRDYIFWKMEQLASLGAKCSVSKIKGRKPLWHLVTRRFPMLGEYHRLFYPAGSKVVPQEALDKLAPLGLAVWLMDDGSFNNRHFDLCTDAWPLPDQERMALWFAGRWNVCPAIQRLRRKRGDLMRLRFRIADSLTLLQLIRPFLHPLFLAKWDVENPQTFQPPLSKSECSKLANARRRELIQAGVLTLGYHTGTVRITPP